MTSGRSGISGSTREIFDRGLKGTLECLYKQADAGIPILMISFPLLERYLREKSGIYEGKLNESFYRELLGVFPELADIETAIKFWQVYRNGLLHQVTTSKKESWGYAMPDGWITGDTNKALKVNRGYFVVHPSMFARRTIGIIEADFTTFEGHGSPHHGLPRAAPMPTGEHGTSGTGRPPTT